MITAPSHTGYFFRPCPSVDCSMDRKDQKVTGSGSCLRHSNYWKVRAPFTHFLSPRTQRSRGQLGSQQSIMDFETNKPNKPLEETGTKITGKASWKSCYCLRIIGKLSEGKEATLTWLLSQGTLHLVPHHLCSGTRHMHTQTHRHMHAHTHTCTHSPPSTPNAKWTSRFCSSQVPLYPYWQGAQMKFA